MYELRDGEMVTSVLDVTHVCLLRLSKVHPLLKYQGEQSMEMLPAWLGPPIRSSSMHGLEGLAGPVTRPTGTDVLDGHDNIVKTADSSSRLYGRLGVRKIMSELMCSLCERSHTR